MTTAPIALVPRTDPTDPAGQDPLEPLLTAADVARILGVRPKRVYELGIPAVRISEHALRWKPSQLAEWIQSREEVR